MLSSLSAQYTSILEQIDHLGYTLVRVPGVSGLNEFLRSCGAHESMISIPTFNPDCNHLNENNSFWYYVERDGIRMGCVAAKLWESDDLGEDASSLRFWYETATDNVYVPTVISNPLGGLSGRWSVGGKLYLRPEARKSGLSKLLTVLIRTVMALEFNTIGHFCLIRPVLVEKHLDTDIYLYPRVSELALSVLNTSTNEIVQLAANYITRDEMARTL